MPTDRYFKGLKLKDKLCMLKLKGKFKDHQPKLIWLFRSQEDELEVQG